MTARLPVVVLGLAVGVAAALPYVACLRAARPSVSRAVIALVASFALLTVAMALVRMLASELLLSFAVPAVLSFLGAVVVFALRGSR